MPPGVWAGGPYDSLPMGGRHAGRFADDGPNSHGPHCKAETDTSKEAIGAPGVP